MNIEYLKSFFVVADTLNFTKAAQLLYISQPTLTKQIKTLEAQLGAELFLRDTHNVVLTAAGQILMEDGASILKKIDRVKDRILSASQPEETIIRIACADYFNQKLFDFFLAYQAEHPDIRLHIYHYMARKGVDAFRTKEADLMITYGFAVKEELKNFPHMKIDENRFCLFVNYKHPFADLESVSLEQLLGENIKIDPFIFPELTAAKVFDSKTWEKLLHDAVCRREGRILSEDVLLMVRAGECIALIPGSVAEQNISGCKTVKIEGLNSGFEVFLLWEKQQNNAKVKHFIESAKQQFKNNCPPQV